ncbi:hypothetical protein, partial [Mesobacillus boroniphilus]|uniref:hypothetical protein n=1 Tax=Mesobacillus boroniphilus TaxID=308892 RepID=UPI00054E532F
MNWYPTKRKPSSTSIAEIDALDGSFLSRELCYRDGRVEVLTMKFILSVLQEEEILSLKPLEFGL